jgi:hypothetical protein
MIERVDDDGRVGRETGCAEQLLFEIRADRKYRVEQHQQAAAAGQIFDQDIRLASRECRARTDIGNDGAVGWDGARLRRHDAARLVADLGERELEPVKLLRRGDQHVAGARRVMAFSVSTWL